MYHVHVTLINDFDKTFAIAFYNSFLKIELNCDKENMYCVCCLT